MRYYPIFLDLRNRWCIVVGGGRVAERKVRVLLRAGASVRVISPAVTPGLARLAACKKISLAPRPYRRGDLKPPLLPGPGGAIRTVLVFAATDRPETQRAVRQDAAAIGAMVNVADDAGDSDFIVPASFAQGDLMVAISTSGASPALARRLRRQLQLTLGRDYRTYLRSLREARKQVLETVPDKSQRARILRKLSGARTMDGLWKGPPAHGEGVESVAIGGLRNGAGQQAVGVSALEQRRALLKSPHSGRGRVAHGEPAVGLGAMEQG